MLHRLVADLQVEGQLRLGDELAAEPVMWSTAPCSPFPTRDEVTTPESADRVDQNPPVHTLPTNDPKRSISESPS